MLEILNFELMNHSEIILMIPELHINSSEFIYIYGENNEGKTLLLSALANEYRHFKGSVKLNSYPVHDKYCHNKIRFIQEIPAILPDKTIMENISIAFSDKKHIQKEAVDLLDQLMLPYDKKIKCAELSHSDLKCIELIRAYLQQPLMLLFDDLDNYFDFTRFEQIYKLILNLKQKGSIIIATGKSSFPKEKQYAINDKRLELK